MCSINNNNNNNNNDDDDDDNNNNRVIDFFISVLTRSVLSKISEALNFWKMKKLTKSNKNVILYLSIRNIISTGVILININNKQI